MGYGRLAELAAAEGDTLDVVTPERFPITSRLPARVHVLFLPLAAAFWLWRRRTQYQVALFHSYAGWVFNLLPRRPPTVTSFHGVEPLEFVELEREHRAQRKRLSLRYRLVHGWMMRKVLRASCRRSARVLCLNTEEREYLLGHGWTTPDRLLIVHHGVPPFFFVDDRVYAPRATRLLFVSQWIPRKGIRYLAQAFTTLARAHPDLQLVCCGTLVSEEGVTHDFPEDVRSRVIVRPTLTQRDLAGDNRDADIFVHVALNEAFGNAIAEAMASALPIVATRVGVALDVLENDRGVLFVPKYDASAIVTAVERLLDDAALRRSLGCTARLAAERLQAVDRDTIVLDVLRGLAH